MQYRKRDGRKAEYKTSDGRWISTGFDTIEEAKENARSGEYSFGRIAKEMCDPDGEYVKMGLYLHPNRMQEHYRAMRAVISSQLIPYFGERDIRAITTRDVQRWVIGMKAVDGSELKPSSKKNYTGVLRSVFRWAIYLGLAESNPVSGIYFMEKDEHGREPFTREELSIMFPEDRDRLLWIWKDIHTALFFMIMRDTGWRPNEVAGLRPSGYSAERRAIYTYDSIMLVTGKPKKGIKTTGRGHDFKVGLLSSQTAGLLEECIATSADGGFVFTHDGLPLKQHMIDKAFSSALKRLGLKHRPPYSLRTTFLTEMIKVSDSETVMELMGHNQWHSCYDQRKPLDVIDKLRRQEGLQEEPESKRNGN